MEMLASGRSEGFPLTAYLGPWAYQGGHFELKGQGGLGNSAACLPGGIGGKGSGSVLPPAESQGYILIGVMGIC